jgi:hypothetical protein
MAAVNTTKLFDNFLSANYAKTYYQYIYDDVENLFHNLKKNNTVLSDSDINKYIVKIYKKKSKSFVNIFINKKEFLLDLLTKNHLLNDNNVNTIIYSLSTVTKKESLDWTWISNLNKLGYVFNKSQITDLKNYGFDGIINKEDNIDELLQVITNNKNKNNIYIEINNICKTKNIIPNNACLKHYIDNIYAQEYKLPTDKEITNILKTFSKHNFVADGKTITLIIQYYNRYGNTNFVDMTRIICHYGAKFTKEHYNAIYAENMYHRPGEKQNLELCKFALEQNIELTLEDLKKQITCKRYHVDNPSLNKDSMGIYELFLDKVNIIPTEELCLYICERGDEIFITVLIDRNIFIPTKNCLIKAVGSQDLYIINNLINMKVEITKEVLENFRGRYGVSKRKYKHVLIDTSENEILNALVGGGLPIDYDVISTLYNKGLYIDLTKYDIEYDDNIYFIVHENSTLTQTPFVVNPYVSKKIYKSYAKFCEDICTLEEIKAYIIKEKFVPNQFCYDNAICNPPTRQWLEDTYNFKPTFITLSRIDDFKQQKKIMNKYFCDTSKHHPFVGSNKEYYVKTT